jgi:hypothetical protein
LGLDHHAASRRAKERVREALLGTPPSVIEP